MKRIGTLILLSSLFSISLTFAQQSKKIDYTNTKYRSFTMPQSADVQFRMEMDTLFPPSFEEECGNTFADYSITDNWGRVSGMNEFLDLQKAQRFSYEGASTYSVNEVGVFFSEGAVVGDGSVVVNIYSVNANGAPSSLLGSSDSLKVSELYVPGQQDPIAPTSFTFSTPPIVSGNQFFVSVDFTALYATQDTVAIFSTEDGCGDGTSTWELFGDGTTWGNYVDSWELNADLAVLVVVEEQEDIVLQPVDTVFTPSFNEDCGQTVSFFGVTDGWGYVSGTNNFSDLEKAQRFDFPGAESYNVSEVGVFFHDATVVGDGEVSVKIYDVANDGSPGNLLGTSNPLKVSELAIDDEFVIPTFFTFSEEIGLTGSQFFASVDLANLYGTQDTVGIFNTTQDCGNGNSTWELFSDGTTWLPYSSQNSWGINVDLFIFVVLEQMATGLNDLSPEEAGLHLQNAYPNPASDQITLDFSLDQQEDINITIYQANGQWVKNHYLGSRARGAHKEVIPLQLNSGVYFYTFSTSKTRILRKFIVQK